MVTEPEEINEDAIEEEMHFPSPEDFDKEEPEAQVSEVSEAPVADEPEEEEESLDDSEDSVDDEEPDSRKPFPKKKRKLKREFTMREATVLDAANILRLLKFDFLPKYPELPKIIDIDAMTWIMNQLLNRQSKTFVIIEDGRVVASISGTLVPCPWNKTKPYWNSEWYCVQASHAKYRLMIEMIEQKLRPLAKAANVSMVFTLFGNVAQADRERYLVKQGYAEAGIIMLLNPAEEEGEVEWHQA